MHIIFSSVETPLCASFVHLTRVNKINQALIRTSWMENHMLAFNLNRFFNVKSYSYLVANSSQHNTNKF